MRTNEPETLLTVTFLLMDYDGNVLCMNCKRQFGVIHECADSEAADTNFCPHCGAKVLQTTELEQGEHFHDLIRRENQ